MEADLINPPSEMILYTDYVLLPAMTAPHTEAASITSGELDDTPSGTVLCTDSAPPPAMTTPYTEAVGVSGGGSW